MKVKVKLYTILRMIAGKEMEVVSLPPKSTVGDLLDILMENHGDSFKSYLYDSEEQLWSYISPLLNGVHIKNLDNSDTMLKDGDVLSLLPPIGGG